MHSDADLSETKIGSRGTEYIIVLNVVEACRTVIYSVVEACRVFWNLLGIFILHDFGTSTGNRNNCPTGLVNFHLRY